MHVFIQLFVKFFLEYKIQRIYFSLKYTIKKKQENLRSAISCSIFLNSNFKSLHSNSFSQLLSNSFLCLA